MTKLNEYFNQTAYQPTWFIGDRVKGTWNKIPFVGTVANDSCIDATPIVSVFLDLPVVYKSKIYNIISINPNDVKELK